ncbi:M28 family metallopeptidase [Haploplasma axanthum]|uniref:Vacuolar membrane protease n=1 Tax=Haploplasma axanthum TaxID=29552 RepID=A0A449BF17_HAPAX|nr:M28 family metallopeptidase [Haploplasma axanthum]VEU81054.1 Arginyl aminopeptidase [Haploplasma axanthum]
MQKISYLLTKRFATLSLIIVLVLSMFVLYTPRPSDSKDESRFSAVRAAEHIEVISRKPHSYYDRDEHEEVRQYLSDTLTSYFGATNVHEMNYSVEEVKTIIDEDLPYEIKNIYGVLKGENEEGIVLMAHYDSRGHVGRYGEQGRSYGAMDDGYGVSTMLEIAYLLKDLNPKNSVYFLFTDAEEVGLYGARLAAKNTEFMKNAKFVINLESRGRYGATYMFETSNNNSKVMDLYKKANYPVTYSMATAVYSVMPNYTDFTPFIETGIAGVNFATLAGLDNYHTPLDSYENINLSSIQHMGTQVEPMVREFISDAKYVEEGYFTSKTNDVFFTLLPNVLITYSQMFAIILSIVLLLGYVAVLFFSVKEEAVDKTIVTKTLPKGLLLTVIFVITSLIFSNIVAFLGKVPFSITYTRVSNTEIPTLILMLGFVYVLFKQIKKSNPNKVLLLGTGINVLLALVTTFTLAGASFLFAVTALFGLIALVSDRVSNKLVRNIILTIAYAVPLLIIIPLLYSFFMALTVGGVALLAVLLIINATVSLPIIIKQFQN